MRWMIDFYHEKRGLVARYDVEASSPAAAVEAGREARVVQYPPAPGSRRPTLFQRAQRVGGRDPSGWVVYRIARLGVAVVLAMTTGIAEADVPKPADIAACNAEASEASRKGKDSRGVTPNSADHNRAADARRPGASGKTTGGPTPSSNPQLEGMDPARAGDPAYQAAFRTCMRRAGF
jgi:hypothetical protein